MKRVLLIACAAALLASVALIAAGWAPGLAAVAFLVLLLRAAHGLTGRPGPLKPRALGFQELGYGVLTAALLVAGDLAGR